MKPLIAFEFKKFFKNKKNLIAIFVFILLILVEIALCISMEKRKTGIEIELCNGTVEQCKQQIDKLKSDYEKTDASDSQGRNFLKEGIDNLSLQKRLNEEKRNAIVSNDWRKMLDLDIQLDEWSLKGMQKSNATSAQNPEALIMEIKKDKFLLKNDIKPIYESCSMTSYNFIRLTSIDILPLFLLIIISLFSSDIMSNENDAGTFKVLLIQPISRTKVLFSKIIASTLINISIILLTLFGFFIGLGITKGFGSPKYPVNYYLGSLSFGYKGTNMDSIRLIGIGKFILYMLPLLILMIIALTAICILISTIMNNSTTAICTSILIYITIYIFNNQINAFKKIAHCIPLTYLDVPDVLNGNMIYKFGNTHITLLFGLIILIVSTMICYFISAAIFKKKDIIC
jgi:ABC-2 type transport system permease protein